MTDDLILRYAKKIYGFAYSKTHHYHDAQDLSQNILLTLCQIDFEGKAISDMDGYIYRVCSYVWSNYVRKNKLFWEGVCYDDKTEQADQSSFEEGLFQSALYEKLRREILYLSKIRREIIVMFYYENKSGKEISDLLGIPASTVRWHLGESKKILKERFDMNDTIYTPKKLTVYFSGSANDSKLAGLRDDLLTQNICIACGKEALSIEEIASTLGLSAAFIENSLQQLLYMGYLEKNGVNKYKTTFMIRDADFFIAQKDFETAHFPALAESIYTAVKDNLTKIRDIGFMGADLDENFLMWDLVTVSAHQYLDSVALPCASKRPVRGDGSAHWIVASWHTDELFKACQNLNPDKRDYIKLSGGAAGKHMGNGKITVQQFDPPSATPWRQPLYAMQLNGLIRILTLIRENLAPNELDKEIIAELAALGYVSVDNGRPQILIPCFTAGQYQAFLEIMRNDILAQIKASVKTVITEEYAKFIKPLIPGYLPQAEKDFILSRLYEPNAFVYLLLKSGKLKAPTESERKRICTIAYETES